MKWVGPIDDGCRCLDEASRSEIIPDQDQPSLARCYIAVEIKSLPPTHPSPLCGATATGKRRKTICPDWLSNNWSWIATSWTSGLLFKPGEKYLTALYANFVFGRKKRSRILLLLLLLDEKSHKGTDSTAEKSIWQLSTESVVAKPAEVVISSPTSVQGFLWGNK